jgi:acyl-CoA synthetase (AMP-forming)/AMP-acid ligase II
VNIAWWLERAADEYRDRVALVDGRRGTSWTYGELRDRSEDVAAVLRDRIGVGTDDVVVTLMPDDLWHNAVFWGVTRIGAVFSGFNRTLAVEKFVADADRLGARFAVVGRQYFDQGRRLLAETGIEALVVCDEGGGDGHPDLIALAGEAHAPVRIAPRRGEDAASINFTGGTSGVSKGVLLPHGALALSAQASVFYDRLVSRDVNLCCISLYHTGGIHDAVKWTIAGATNVMIGGWEAGLAASLISEHRPSWIYFWVPTMARDLMRHPAWDTLPLDGLKCIISGETVPPELQQQLLDRGIEVSNSLGMSETMPVGILKPLVAHGDRPPLGSCGRPMSELCDVVLKDPDTGAVITRPDVVGEICVRGPVVSPGYVNDPARTAAAFDGEGYLHTRDVARFDAEGWWFLGGRTDDIINSGAEKLSLTEVEETLRAHPQLRDVACTGVAHERFGTVPAAVVVSDLAEDELAVVLDAHCLLHLERWKRPRLYVRVDEIPRTMPKRTKDLGALRALVTGIEVATADPVRAVTPAIAEGTP